MKLSVLERINLMGILPQESNFITFKILTELKNALSFSEKEIKDYKIEQKVDATGAGKVYWDSRKEKEKEIEIGEQMNSIIKIALQKVDKEGKVNDGNISLFEKFQPEVGLEVKK